MHRLERCPCCDGVEFQRWPALVAPFIAEYALQRPVEASELRQCRGCGFRFFADRFDGDEVARLYGGYRGQRYFAARHHHEPWYTHAVNDGLGASPERRQQRIRALLVPHVELSKVDSVLDYGGDAGQMIPEGLGSERFVFELSDVPPIAGVKRVAAERDLRPRGYDVVILSHVLEHHSEPLGLLRTVGQLSRGLVYIEVPFERPRILAGQGRFAAAWLEKLKARPAALRAVDFVSTALRLYAGVVPPLGFPKLHEHLNFFDAGSLEKLATRAGLRVLSCARASKALRGREDVIACVAAAG